MATKKSTTKAGSKAKPMPKGMPPKGMPMKGTKKGGKSC